eukprot:gene2009-2472_t
MDVEEEKINKFQKFIHKYINNNQKEWNPPIKYREKKVEEYATDLANFIDRYKYLYELRSLDFFTSDIWNRLIPDDWKEPLLSMSDEEAMNFHKGIIVKDEWPESLKSFIGDAVSLWMPKDVYKSDWELRDLSFSSLFLKMSEKKIHEVLIMSEFINDVVVSSGIIEKPNEIVDIGAGECYLSQVLSHHFRYSVTAVDCSASFLEGAKKRQDLIEVQRIASELKKLDKQNKELLLETNQQKELKKKQQQQHQQQQQQQRTLDDIQQKTVALNIKNEKLQLQKQMINDFDVKSPELLVAMIDSDMKGDDFLDLLKQHNPEKNYESLMLVGLHTCGILPPTMIKNFVQCNHINSMIDVGCCYYKIEDGANHEFMSDHCRKKIGNLVLGPAALKLSCEASDSSQCNLQEYQYSCKVHFYRVLLETALKCSWGIETLAGTVHNYTIRNISRTKSQTFESYAKSALERMNNQQKQFKEQQLENTDTDDPRNKPLPTLEYITNDIYNQYKDHIKKVNIFLLLRGLLAPVLESLIVLDRYIYLKEQNESTNSASNIHSYIIPIFNHNLSPRNLVILCLKTNKSTTNLKI